MEFPGAVQATITRIVPERKHLCMLESAGVLKTDDLGHGDFQMRLLNHWV